MIALQDNFHGANQAIADHTPQIGGPWELVAGNVNIAGNVALCADAGNNNSCKVDTPNLGNLANARVSGEVEITGNMAGLFLQVSLQADANNYILISCAEGEGPKLRMVKGGQGIASGSDDTILPTGTHGFEFGISGSKVSGKIGDLALSFQSPDSYIRDFNKIQFRGGATAAGVVAWKNVTVSGQNS